MRRNIKQNSGKTLYIGNSIWHKLTYIASISCFNIVLLTPKRDTSSQKKVHLLRLKTGFECGYIESAPYIHYSSSDKGFICFIFECKMHTQPNMTVPKDVLALCGFHSKYTYLIIRICYEMTFWTIHYSIIKHIRTNECHSNISIQDWYFASMCLIRITFPMHLEIRIVVCLIVKYVHIRCINYI